MKEFEYPDELYSQESEDLRILSRILDAGEYETSRGELREAEKLFLTARFFSESAFGPYHWTQCDVLTCLHYLQSLQGRHSEAEVTFALCEKIMDRF